MDFRKSVVLCVAILVLSALVRPRSLFRGLKWATTDCRSAGEWVASDLLHFRSPLLEGPTKWSFVVDGLEGAAMWLPPGVGPDVEEMMRILDENANEQTTESLGQATTHCDAEGTIQS